MKKSPIIVTIIVVIIIIGYFVLSKSIGGNGPKATPTPTPEQANNNIEKIPENSINVTFEPRYDKKAFTMIIKGLNEKGFKQFEYEISYDAQSSEDPTQTITQGSASREPVLVTDKDFEREILLGTCSKNVCKYDKGVKRVKIVIKLIDIRGKIKLWEKEFSME